MDILLLEQKGCNKESYSCKDQLLMNQTIIENFRSKLKNISMAWVDYKNAFDNVLHEWILKVLNILNISPVMIIFLKYNMKK